MKEFILHFFVFVFRNEGGLSVPSQAARWDVNSWVAAMAF